VARRVRTVPRSQSGGWARWPRREPSVRGLYQALSAGSGRSSRRRLRPPSPSHRADHVVRPSDAAVEVQEKCVHVLDPPIDLDRPEQRVTFIGDCRGAPPAARARRSGACARSSRWKPRGGMIWTFRFDGFGQCGEWARGAHFDRGQLQIHSPTRVTPFENSEENRDEDI
jgi:hypothetical protein